MSYNYLPLDHQLLQFEQIENLIEYQQLLSITFTAHEQITATEAAIKPNFTTQDANTTIFSQSTSASVSAKNIAVAKLVLAFKIKSLSYGKSGVHIETVKLLLQLYNLQLIPILNGIHYTENEKALGILCQILQGNGAVFFSNDIVATQQALQQIQATACSLSSTEIRAITTGNQFTTANFYFILQSVQQMLAICSHSFAAAMQLLHAATFMLDATTNLIRRDAAYKQMAKHLKQLIKHTNATTKNIDCFKNIVHVLANCSTAFNYAKEIFVQEINIPSEAALFNSTEQLFVTNTNSNIDGLKNAVDNLFNPLKKLLHTVLQVNEYLCVVTDSVVAINNQETTIPAKYAVENTIHQLQIAIAIQLQLVNSIQLQATNAAYETPIIIQQLQPLNLRKDGFIESVETKQVIAWFTQQPSDSWLYNS